MRKVFFGLLVLVFVLGCGGSVKKADLDFEKYQPSDTVEITEQSYSYDEETISWKATNGDTLANKAWELWKGRYYYPEILKLNSEITNADLIYAGKVYQLPRLD